MKLVYTIVLLLSLWLHSARGKEPDKPAEGPGWIEYVGSGLKNIFTGLAGRVWSKIPFGGGAKPAAVEPKPQAGPIQNSNAPGLLQSLTSMLPSLPTAGSLNERLSSLTSSTSGALGVATSSMLSALSAATAVRDSALSSFSSGVWSAAKTADALKDYAVANVAAGLQLGATALQISADVLKTNMLQIANFVANNPALWALIKEMNYTNAQALAKDETFQAIVLSMVPPNVAAALVLTKTVDKVMDESGVIPKIQEAVNQAKQKAGKTKPK